MADWTTVLGDAFKVPGGAHDIKNFLSGNPDAIKAAYDKAMGDAKQGGQDITNFLMGQQGKAQQYYQPLQNMYNSAYGGGIQGPQTPQTGQPMLPAMYGR